MTTLGRREKCLRNRSKKDISGVWCPSDPKPAPYRRLWKHRGPKLAKALPREALWYTRRVGRRVKTEIAAQKGLPVATHGWREVWDHFNGRGAFPHQLAFLLLNPLRSLIFSPRELVARLHLTANSGCWSSVRVPGSSAFTLPAVFPAVICAWWTCSVRWWIGHARESGARASPTSVSPRPARARCLLRARSLTPPFWSRCWARSPMPQPASSSCATYPAAAVSGRLPSSRAIPTR
jgi:hypothetical protein